MVTGCLACGKHLDRQGRNRTGYCRRHSFLRACVQPRKTRAYRLAHGSRLANNFVKSLIAKGMPS